ncbi:MULTISPECIES: DUF1622 domain-containing protein [Jannaschia]|nr:MULTISPECIES: DUF1622 domain-containing protein [unclassified Jannaschia]
MDQETEGPVRFRDYLCDVSLPHGDVEWPTHATDCGDAAIDMTRGARLIRGYLWAERSREGERRVRRIKPKRLELGRYVLAGPELLIASDIIRAALSLAMVDLLYLRPLVVIRAVISYYLDREPAEVERGLPEWPGSALPLRSPRQAFRLTPPTLTLASRPIHLSTASW